MKNMATLAFGHYIILILVGTVAIILHSRLISGEESTNSLLYMDERHEEISSLLQRKYPEDADYVKLRSLDMSGDNSVWVAKMGKDTSKFYVNMQEDQHGYWLMDTYVEHNYSQILKDKVDEELYRIFGKTSYIDYSILYQKYETLFDNMNDDTVYSASITHQGIVSDSIDLDTTIILVPAKTEEESAGPAWADIIVTELEQSVLNIKELHLFLVDIEDMRKYRRKELKLSDMLNRYNNRVQVSENLIVHGTGSGSEE